MYMFKAIFLFFFVNTLLWIRALIAQGKVGIFALAGVWAWVRVPGLKDPLLANNKIIRVLREGHAIRVKANLDANHHIRSRTSGELCMFSTFVHRSSHINILPSLH
jgi:uncharacterized protein YqfA (UPF0365 family)